MSERLCLVVMGIMGCSPFAGVVWQVLHYLEGFRRLGHEVYYVEDTREWPYDPERNAVTDDCTYTVNHLERAMAWCGLGNRWAYRAESQDSRLFGLSETELTQVCRRADVLVNLHGSAVMRDEYLHVPVRIYLETDPVWAQLQVASGEAHIIDLLGAHTHRFSFGENLGAPDCDVPLERFDYHPTRQPVVGDWWWRESAHGWMPAPDRCFTTIANWRQSLRDRAWQGDAAAASKHGQFLQFVDLPRRTRQSLELALAGAGVDDVQLLTSHGWRVADAVAVSKDMLVYRDYIWRSRGEFTIAKDRYTRPRSGWFSDRSACYLAAGKPVIAQNTGFAKIFPTGRGLFAFETIEDVLGAIEEIERDYDGQCRAAREIAAEHFAAERVLGGLLERAGM